MTYQQKRVLGRLSAVDAELWHWRHSVTRWLGRYHKAVDELVEAGWLEERSVRVGKRGRERREVRVTVAGVIALMGQTPTPDSVLPSKVA